MRKERTDKDIFDPEVYEFYKAALEGPGFAADLSNIDFDKLRRGEISRFKANSYPYEVKEKTDIDIDRGDETSLWVRVYVPGEESKELEADEAKSGAGDDSEAARKTNGLPVLLYFHGGGFIMGGIEGHDHVCGKLADACEAIVVSVEYRLAPEYPFPACIDDALLAAEWVYANADQIGADRDSIMAGGDSAGATIAAALALLLKKGKSRSGNAVPEIEKTAPEISKLILFYGTYGCIDIAESDSAKQFGQEDFVLPVDAIDVMMKYYIPEGTDPDDERLAPGCAGDLSGMPPAYVVSAEFDPLRDDGEEFARRLKAAGNEVKFVRMDGMMHGFIVYWQRFSRAERLIDEVGEWVKGL